MQKTTRIDTVIKMIRPVTFDVTFTALSLNEVVVGCGAVIELVEVELSRVVVLELVDVLVEVLVRVKVLELVDVLVEVDVRVEVLELVDVLVEVDVRVEVLELVDVLVEVLVRVVDVRVEVIELVDVLVVMIKAANPVDEYLTTKAPHDPPFVNESTLAPPPAW
jgi:hypothetical protein